MNDLPSEYLTQKLNLKLMIAATLPDARRIWIFQCNPDKYKIKEALADPQVINCFHWKVKQHKKEIRKVHIGLIWCSGASAGIYAITELISDPGLFKESDHEKDYWSDNSDEEGVQYRVQMKLIKNLVDDPITKERIKRIDGLQDLSILKMPRGTNFSVTEEEWGILKGLM